MVRFGLSAVGAWLVVLVGCAQGQKPSPSDPTPTLQRFDFLAGTWRTDASDQGLVVEETWAAPEGTFVLGSSQTFKQGQRIAYECMRIELDADQVVFRARPTGQTETRFPLVSVGKHEVVFENLQHDFPQRIRYRREDGERLSARLEGPGASGPDKSQFVDYRYRRSATPQHPPPDCW